jgi:hypothetical protein
LTAIIVGSIASFLFLVSLVAVIMFFVYRCASDDDQNSNPYVENNSNVVEMTTARDDSQCEKEWVKICLL